MSRTYINFKREYLIFLSGKIELENKTIQRKLKNNKNRLLLKCTQKNSIILLKKITTYLLFFPVAA